MTYTIYGRSGCQPCASAKTLLESKGLPYEYLDIMEKPEMREVLLEMNLRTVPQIFLGSQHIGGFDDLKSLLTS